MALTVPAQAATVSVEDGVFTYVADAGEVNDFEAWPDLAPDSMILYEYGADITPGPGCAPVPEPLALPGVYLSYSCVGVTAGASLDLGDQSDFAVVFTPGDAPIEVKAGDGDDFVGLGDGKDTIDAGPGIDTIYGGLGEDVLGGGDGDDRIYGDYGTDGGGGEGEGPTTLLGDADSLDGGAGNDRLLGDGGADLLAGGAGVDTVDYSGRSAPISVSLDGAAGDGQAGEADSVAADVEGVMTGRGNDVVTGTAGADVLSTGDGDDTIDAGGGEDQIDAGEGADKLALRDGTVDTVDCGEGRDEAEGDDNEIAEGCEVLRSPGNPSGAPRPATGAGPPALVMPSGLELRLVGKARKGRVRLAGRLVLPAGTDPRLCTGTAVRVVLKAGRRKRTLTEVLGTDCSFSAAFTLRVRKSTRAAVSASFGGSASLGGAVSAPLKLKLRR